MSKNHSRSRHRIPDCALELKPDPIDERYQAEIDASIAKLEQRYRRAQKALEAAARRAERGRVAVEHARTSAKKRVQRDYDKLLLIVEERRAELREIEILMMPTAYNGRDSRRRMFRHETGAITVPIGPATGQKPKQQVVPVFPVVVKTGPSSTLSHD